MTRLSSLQRLLAAAVVIGVMLLAVGCPQHRSIAEINRDPGRFIDKEVAVSGTVTESFGALGTGIYQIDDGTGRLWVFSDQYGVPSKGSHVGVAGRISPTATFAGRSFATVLRESKRRR
jgi:hypothetical protein